MLNKKNKDKQTNSENECVICHNICDELNRDRVCCWCGDY